MAIMRLTKNSILFVKCYEFHGITYSWFVGMKSRKVSDARNFVNYENGKTVIKHYSAKHLPKAVQNFMNEHEYKEITEDQDTEFKICMWA